MQQILLFAGTIEGRHLVEHFQDAPFSFTVCVATEYGKEILPQGKQVEVLAQRLSMEEMKELMQRKDFLCVIDATHPYATVVTDNIKAACQKAGVPYRRINGGPERIGRMAASSLSAPSTKRRSPEPYGRPHIFDDGQ